METWQPFNPSYGDTQAVAVSTTPTLIGIDPYAPNVRILNTTTAVVFFRITAAGVTAPASTATNPDMPIAPNMATVVTKGNNHTQVSLVAASGSGTVYVTPGLGF